jgi:HEAT repeat protein
MPDLIEKLSSPHWYTRGISARALGRIGNIEGAAALIPLLRDPSPYVRGAAAEALGEVGDKASAKNLESALQAEDDSAVREIIRSSLLILR